MANIYFIQLAGILLIAGGIAALTASATIYGRSLTRSERSRMGNENRNTNRLPINLATVASTAFVLAGVGILAWSNFNVCSYLMYWFPGMSDSISLWLSCR